jgi:hypothetical protein
MRRRKPTPTAVPRGRVWLRDRRSSAPDLPSRDGHPPVVPSRTSPNSSQVAFDHARQATDDEFDDHHRNATTDRHRTPAERNPLNRHRPPGYGTRHPTQPDKFSSRRKSDRISERNTFTNINPHARHRSPRRSDRKHARILLPTKRPGTAGYQSGHCDRLRPRWVAEVGETGHPRPTRCLGFSAATFARNVTVTTSGLSACSRWLK